MNEMLFRQLERMLKESRYQSSCHSYKDIEKRVLSLTDDQLYEATEMMYFKGPKGYSPSFNFPNIAFCYIEKGDVNSPIFESMKNRIIFWENFINQKPDLSSNKTFLEALVERNSDLNETEVQRIAAIAMNSNGTKKYENTKEEVISRYGKPCDNSVLIDSFIGSYASHELYKWCEKETQNILELTDGYFINKKSCRDINDLKFLVLKHHSFESMMYMLVYEFYATDCIYQEFLDNVAFSITERLESCKLNYEFLEDVIKDRFEIYGELDMEDEFESELARDIITIEKILNIRPYPYNSLMA